jgi:hypothetical protein
MPERTDFRMGDLARLDAYPEDIARALSACNRPAL